MTLKDIARKLDTIDTRLSSLEQKVDEGFRGSQIRDEELHRLTRFGLEADEVLRESMNRRFDVSDRKHDDQISLLEDVMRQNLTKS